MLKLPKIPYDMTKNKQQVVSMGNINYSKMTQDGDVADSNGVSGRYFPYITTAKGCSEAIGEVENCKSATLFDEKWVQVDASGVLYYGGQLVGQLEPGEKQFAAINTKLVIMPDKKYLDISGEAPELKDMEGKAAGLASFGDASASETTNSITLYSPHGKIGEGYGISQTDGETTLNWVKELHNGPIAVVDAGEKSAMFFCEDLGVATLTENSYYATGVFDVSWITKTDEATTIAEGDILIFGDGAAYKVNNAYTSDSFSFLVLGEDNWDFVFSLTALEQNSVRVYRSTGLSDDVKSEMAGIGAFYSEDLGGIVRGSVYHYGIDEHVIRMDERRDPVVFDGIVTSVGWPSDTDLTELTEGAQIIFKVEGYAYAPATVESVSTSASGAVIYCPSPWPSFTPLSEDADDLFYCKVEILILEPLVLSECFKIGDCVTVTGDSLNQKNNLNFVISDIVDNTLYASSDIFVADAAHCRDLTIERKVPDLDYICEHDNRLYGCSIADNTIYASALGDPTNVYAYQGISTDSYAVAVASEGPFTGCCPYDGGVMFWKSDKLHKLLGSYPAEYALYTYNIDGVQAGSHRSLQNINEVLYYKGDRGVFSFDGSPHLISQNFADKRFSCAVGGNDGERYYVSMVDEDKKAHLFSYNTRTGLWVREGDRKVSGFVRSGNDAYILEDGEIKLYGAKETPPDAEWFVQFTPIYETIEGHKSYSRIKLRAEIPKGSYMIVSMRCDGGRWAECGKVVGKREGLVPIMVPVNRCDKFEIRLSGKGPCTIHSILREFYVGGDR